MKKKLLLLFFFSTFTFFFSNKVISKGSLSKKYLSLPLVEIYLPPQHSYKNQFITVYYGFIKPYSLSLSLNFKFSEVFEKVTLPIPVNSNQIIYQSPKKILYQFILPINSVIVVIHPQPQYTFINIDGSIPQNEDPNYPHVYTDIKTILIKPENFLKPIYVYF